MELLKKYFCRSIRILSLFLLIVQMLITSFLPVFALNDTTKTWNFTAATVGDYTYDSNLLAVDDSGAHPVSGVNKITNPAFATDNSSWSVAAVPPTGWVEVPGNGTLGTSNFLSMQYEAKYDNDSNLDGDDAGTGTPPTGCRVNASYDTIDWGNTSSPCPSSWTGAKLVSTANGSPIAGVSHDEAVTACSQLTLNGNATHLIRNPEWMTIARNAEAVDSNWTGGTAGSGCMFRGNSGDTTCGYNGPDPDKGGSRDVRAKFTLSNGAQIYDISGNVWEHVNFDADGDGTYDEGTADKVSRDQQPEATTDGTTPITDSAYTWSEYYGTGSTRRLLDNGTEPPFGDNVFRPLNNTYNSSQGVGKIYHWSNSTTSSTQDRVFQRGGGWGITSDTGAFALRLGWNSGSTLNGVGFRCASDPVAISQSFSSSSGRAGGGNTVTIGSISDGKIYQSVNVGDTSTYDFSVYVYDSTSGGGTVSSSVAQLYYNGSTISTTYIDAGSGWWKLTGTLAGDSSTREYGVLVKAGKTVKVDDFTLSQQGEYSVYTTSAYSNSNVQSWDSFSAADTASGNASVVYQLCTDDGSTCESGSSWQYWTGSAWATATNTTTHVNTEAQLTQTSTQALPVASTKISVKAILNFGGADTPDLDTIMVGLTTDTAAPTISLTALSPDPTTDTTPSISGTATEDIDTVSTVEFQMDSTSGSWAACTADDGAFDEAAETFTCTSSALSDGSHTIYVRATDSNGNTTAGGSEASDNFTVDTTAPSTPGTPSTSSPTSDTTPTWSWTASTDATSGLASTPYTLEWSQSSSFSSGVSSSTSSTNSFTHITPLTDGTWYFRVMATDAAGNDSSYSSNGSVQINTGAPSGTITINSGDSYVGTRSVNLSLTTSSGFFTDTSSISMKISNLADLSDGSYEAFSSSKSWTLSTGDGTKTVYVQFKDSTDNESGAYSDTITLDTVSPNSFDLQDPQGNSYTSDERPTFRWKAASTTDATSGLAKYELQIDNGSEGDFSVDNIPPDRNTTYETFNYKIEYENFSDNDASNNYISVITKSSIFWGSDKNDGKVKEGKRSWKVVAVDKAGNSRTEGRTLFVDFSKPKVEVTNLNNFQFSISNLQSNNNDSISNFQTTDKSPTITGKLTDSLAGEDNGQNQNDTGPKVASGPKEVKIKFEKKNEKGFYDLHTLATVNLTDIYWSDGEKVTDNSKNSKDKYSTFEFTPQEELPLGDYRVKLIGKDKAGNSGEASFYLKIGTFDQVATEKQKAIVEKEILKQVQDDKITSQEAKQVKEELEITKPSETIKPSLLEKASSIIKSFWIPVFTGMTKRIDEITKQIAVMTKNIGHGIQTALNSVGQTVKFVFNSEQVANIFFKVGEKAQDVSDTVGSAIVKFGYILVKEPTKISDIQVKIISKTSVKISWKTNHPATGKINWGFDDGVYAFEKQTGRRTTSHEFTLTNLKPGIEYHYEVMSQNKNYVYDANRRFKIPKK